MDIRKIEWNKTKTIKLLVLTIVLSLLFVSYAYLVETHCCIDRRLFLDSVVSVRSLLVFLATGVITFVVLLLGAERIFRYRYLIASVLFALFVVLGVSGSSVGLVSQYLGSTDTDILFGVSRPIRTDEWAVFTPMTWSQYYGSDSFPYFSSVVRAASTDVFIEYGQPIHSFLMVFRPFQIGYLFLPVANGMAFFWMGRLIALFMVSFEFGRLITNDNRRLSILYAVMVAFAPAVQWWFAINGFVEMLIFMQLSIIVFNQYLKAVSLRHKMIYALIVAVCAGGYALTMYPAWMIPLAYTLLAFIVWTIIQYKNKFKFHKSDALILFTVVLLLSLSALYLYKQSQSTIDIISSTVYPGKRVNNGGGFLFRFFNSFTNIWYPLNEQSTYDNTCESAGFISLFPLGLILYIKYTFQTRKKDILAVLLLVVEAFLGCYCFFGLPSLIAKITFVNMSIPSRAMVILGFTDLLLLVRSLHLCESSMVSIPTWHLGCEVLVITSFVLWMAYSINNDYFTDRMLIIQFVLMAVIIGLVLLSLSNLKMRRVSSSLLLVTVLLSGLLVNPIRIGVKSVENNPVLQRVSETVSEDPEGIWILEGISFPYNNFLIMEGARTINTTNVYPYVERWESIDDGEDDSAIYNRYAHIQINYDNNPEEEFRLIAPDNFAVSINEDELIDLDVDYVFTNHVFEDSDPFRLLYSENGFYVYKVDCE